MRRPGPLLALVGVTAIWGVTFVQVQDALELYPLFAFLAVRFAISVVVLAPFAWSSTRGLSRREVAIGLGLGILLAAAFGLQTAGLELTTVASTGFITGLYVVFTPLIALGLFRTHVPPAAWAGIALALVGLLLLNGVPGGSTLGNALVLASAARGRVPDRGARALRAALRPARAHVPADDDVLRRVRRHRGGARRARGSTRLDGVGRADRHGRVLGCARIPHRDLGPGADDGCAGRARLHAGGTVRRALRRPAGRRGARVGRLARMRRDDGRHRPRGAGRGERAPSASPGDRSPRRDGDRPRRRSRRSSSAR